MKISNLQLWVPAFAGMTIILLFSFFLMFHTFSYNPRTHTILIARTLWSDFGAHIPLIRSFSVGDNVDLTLKGKPQYPLYSGEKMRYHFLFYALVGVLEKAGVRLDWALNIPSALGFALLLWGIWSLAMLLFGDKRVAVLSIIFFLFNGSLAFLKFFTQHPLSLDTPLDILRANAFPAFGPWDGGTITAFWNLNIYTNQRHLAVGLCIALGFILTILTIGKKSLPKQIPWAILWGMIIGLLPYLHTPTLVILAILFVSYVLLFPASRRFLLIAGSIGAVLVIPQLLRFPAGSSSIRWYPGYLIHDQLSLLRFLGYWWQNLGLHAILIPIGFFLLPKRAQKVLVPLFLLFAMGNLFKFSPEIAANHKFFNFALILGNMVSAYVILAYARIQSKIIRWIPAPRSESGTRFAGMTLQGGLLIVFIGMLTLSGIIDFFVIVNDQKGGVADVGNNEAATWIAANTPKDAIFLNSSFLYHPASLAGRKVFLGWPYFSWSAGYDTDTRMKEMKTLYENKNPNVFCPILEKHHISYITVEDTKADPNLPNIDVSYFRDTYPSVFQDAAGKLRIYESRARCPS